MRRKRSDHRGRARRVGRALARALLAELPPARAARVVAAVTAIARDAVYARAIAIKPG
jgi:hypothetical protein